MKVFIRTGGDRSTGINQGEVVVDFVREPVENNAMLESVERSVLRQQFADFFENVWGDGTGIGVRFEDECYECGTALVHQQCPNQNCASLFPPTPEESDPSHIWNDEHVQFVRLLAEISMMGLEPVDKEALCESMDLESAELEELFVRAERRFEQLKRQHNPRYVPDHDLDESEQQ